MKNYFVSAKTPWSWGRMHDFFSSVHFLGGREIESRRQPCERERNEKEGEKMRVRKWKTKKNETKKGKPANDQWRASALEIKKNSILSLKQEKETRFEGCGKNCELNDHLTHETGSIQEKELQQENRAVGGSSSLNVTQAAGQKGEMERIYKWMWCSWLSLSSMEMCNE